MYAAEFDAFKQTLTDTCVAVNRPVNDDLVRVFWEDLREYRLADVQAEAKRIRAEGKTKFTSADFRPARRNAPTFEAPPVEMDRFDRVANRQLFKFLRLYDTTPEQLPALLRRKREIVEAARVDPEMQWTDDPQRQLEQGRELHEILFSAWRKVIGAELKPSTKSSGFAQVTQ